MDICTVSRFWLLYAMLLWTVPNKCLCGHMFSVLWGWFLKVRLLDHIVTLCLSFWENVIIQSRLLTFPTIIVDLFLPSVLWNFSCHVLESPLFGAAIFKLPYLLDELGLLSMCNVHFISCNNLNSKVWIIPFLILPFVWH